ncbi:unnamed protein product [Peniophora sp. CBMAI 1063]|nr:unnamed protein product [Peniophora sp. CBMAI 1063]
MPPDVGVQAGESMVPPPRPLATANKFNSGSPIPPVMVKRPSKVTVVEVEDEGEVERPMRVVTAVAPPKQQAVVETPEISMPPRKRTDSTSSTRSRSSVSNSTPARVTPSPNLRNKQPSPALRGKQSPIPPNPRIGKPSTPGPVSRSQTEPKLPSIAEKPLPSAQRTTRGLKGDDADFPDPAADPSIAAMLAKFAEGQAKAAQEIRAKSPEAARAMSPTNARAMSPATARAMSPETVRAKSPETARAQSPTARGNDLRFRSFSEAQTSSTPPPMATTAAARRMRSPIPPSTSPAPSGWRRAGTPAGTAASRPAASRSVSSNAALPATKTGPVPKGGATTSDPAKSLSSQDTRQASLAQKAEQLRIKAEQDAAEKRRIAEEKERELEARMMAMREEQRKREEEAARAQEEEKQRVAAEEEKKRLEAEARVEEERRMQEMWASRTKGKQPQTSTIRADPKGKGKQRAVEVEDVEASPPARGRVKVDHEFALRLQAEELARAQAAPNQNLQVKGNTIHAPTAISPSPSWSMPAPRGPTTAATSTPAPAWTTWGKSTTQLNLASPPSHNAVLSPPGQNMPGAWATTPQVATTSPPWRAAGLSPPGQAVGTSPATQSARLSPENAAARDEAEWQRRMDERARAQAEAFQREQERLAHERAQAANEAVHAAAGAEKMQAEEAEVARMRAEEDRRFAEELQSEEWRQAAMRREAPSEQVGGVSQATGSFRLKEEIEERKRVAQERARAAAALRAQAEARRRDAEALTRIWEGRGLAGHAIAA